MSMNTSAPPISAADPASAAPPCLTVEAAWEHFAECGLAAWEADRTQEAAACLRTAATLAAAFADTDPRRAAALTSLAAVEADSGSDAAAALADTLPAWDRAEAWISAMAPDHKPRSSLFHHRLEQKHAGAYAEIARAGYRRLLGGGRAACLNNLALRLTGSPAEAAAMLREAARLREIALGARDVGAMRILANLADLLAGQGDLAAAADCRRRAAEIAARHPIPALERWRSRRPPRLTDSRRLEAAVLLIPVLRMASPT
jgi:tetratricopeptide (TPR) repeat protein